MREILWPPLRALGLTVLLVGLLMLMLNPPDLDGLGSLIAILAGAAAIVLATALITVLAIGREMPEPDFRKLAARSDALAALPAPPRPPSWFDDLVTDALDELPSEFQALLEDVPVVVSDKGVDHGAYGLYVGDTVARDGYPDRILIFEDTLVRDFGHNPEVLRVQVRRTVRHELAHHLGWNESGVRNLGL